MEAKQTQAEIDDDKRLGETLDRYRNQGTMAGKVMIDRDSLESIVESRINRALIERFESMIHSTKQWQIRHDTKKIDPAHLIIKIISKEIDKLKS